MAKHIMGITFVCIENNEKLKMNKIYLIKNGNSHTIV
jgi:hypothetical protein